MKKVPDIVSYVRMAVSVGMVFLVGKPVGFLLVFVLCLMANYGNSLLWKKLHWEEQYNTQIDMYARLVFTTCTIFAFVGWMDVKKNLFVLIAGIMIAMVRVGNLFLTKKLFQQWGIIKTISLQVAHVALFVALPVGILLGAFPLYITLPLLLIEGFSALEETMLLITSKVYEPERKSILFNAAKHTGHAEESAIDIPIE